MTLLRPTLALGVLALLAACSSAPPVAPAPPFDVVAAVKAIRAAGGADSTELDVQPLRDSQIEDLRDDAVRLERVGKYPEAATALDQALAINAGDPALLQERAETALLMRQADDAERFARRAIDLGSQVGPLCRRHWETVAQANGMRAHDAPPVAKGEDAARAASESAARQVAIRQARQKRDACTVAAPPRY